MPHDKKPVQATEAPGLREQVQPIVDRLPPIVHHPRLCGEIDYYGARFCIAQSLGLSRPLFGRATWLHGWIWYDCVLPGAMVDEEMRSRNNLVFSTAQETYLKRHGFKNAIAVGAPFLYAEAADVPRIPNSLLVFPMHTTGCSTLTLHEETYAYVEYVKRLRERFSLVVASIGCEDVRRGNWIPAFEKAGIPWITGAWTYDQHALVRMQSLMRHFEYATSNNPGSHFAYAAFCGCKMSFHGPACDTLKVELDTHPHHKRYPEITKTLKELDLSAQFQTRFPFFFTDPREAAVQVDWARLALGENNKKPPEEIAELFEWKLRKLPSGRYAPINPHDALTNEELFAKAMAKSLVGRHDAAFKLTDELQRRHVRARGLEVIRARYFLNSNNSYGAREALKAELRHFPDNEQAVTMLEAL